jgi:hypothetical protein
MASDILAFLSHPLFALFFACVICALQISGVITVKLARLFLFAAWLVAVIGTSTMLNNAPLGHRAIVAGLVGIPTALLLFFVERLITKTVKKRESKTPILLSNIELKKQAKQLADDMLQFISDRRANEPQVFLERQQCKAELGSA